VKNNHHFLASFTFYPYFISFFSAPLAQMVEQLPFKDVIGELSSAIVRKSENTLV
jgi:hypothetical protein